MRQHDDMIWFTDHWHKMNKPFRENGFLCECIYQTESECKCEIIEVNKIDMTDAASIQCFWLNIYLCKSLEMLFDIQSSTRHNNFHKLHSVGPKCIQYTRIVDIGIGLWQ